MSANPVHLSAVVDAMPAEAGPIPTIVEPSVEPDLDRETLSRLLHTERSASSALLAALRELERRLVAERADAQDLRTKVASERAASTFQLNQNAQLWGEVETLKAELEHAQQKPFWQRLLAR
jgi:hypothetical protein